MHRSEILETVWRQSKELVHSTVKVTCTCGKNISLRYAYKCLYCGIFFCKSCAKNHFGDNKDGRTN
jgi:hypothetical protein